MSDAPPIRLSLSRALLAALTFCAVTAFLPPPASAQAPSPREAVGATVLGQGTARSVFFRLWAPNASSVGIQGDFTGHKPDAMQRDPQHPGHWISEQRKARPGDAYQFHIDGLLRRDPRGRAVEVDANRAFVVDPRDFPWGPVATAWKMPPKEDLVLYEMHLGSFAQNIPGNDSPFERAIKRLPYLKSIGINAIQLMPVNEFSGDRSWGYNPSDLFAIESSYGGEAAFKSFIRACHTNGIAVLLDIVHNHYGPEQIATWQFDRTDGDGPYFYSDSERRSTDWGPRPDFSRPEVREFIADSVRMFLSEFRIDGFRWDSVHNIRYFANGAHANPDGDRLLSEINTWMRQNTPAALRIAEDHAFDAGGVGFDAQWHSAFQASLSALVCATGPRDFSAFAATLESLSWEWVNFADCHDSAGDLNSHHRLPAYIDPSHPDGPRARALALLANGIIMTVPGFPMLLQGFELHDTLDFSDRNPVPWDKAKANAGILRANADLIHLRRDLKGWTPGLKGDVLRIIHRDDTTGVLAYTRAQRNAPRDRATVVVLNFANRPLKQYGVRFPSAGAWFCHYNSGRAAYDPGFDNAGPAPGQGYGLPAGQTTLPLDLSSHSIQIFSKERPPNASLVKAAFAAEIQDPSPAAPPPKAETPFVEETIPPFPYAPVPLPAD